MKKHTCCMCGYESENLGDFNPYFYVQFKGFKPFCVDLPQCNNCIQSNQNVSDDGGVIHAVINTEHPTSIPE